MPSDTYVGEKNHVIYARLMTCKSVYSRIKFFSDNLTDYHL